MGRILTLGQAQSVGLTDAPWPLSNTPRMIQVVTQVGMTPGIMYAWASTPAGYPGTRKWPVVMQGCGGGKDWLPEHLAFRAECDAQGYPFLVITPLLYTNGGAIATWPTTFAAFYTPPYVPRKIYNSPFLTATTDAPRVDQDGHEGLLIDLTAHYRSSGKAFMAGFSASGHFANMIGLSNPEFFRAIALAACNFVGEGVPLPAYGFPDGNPAGSIPANRSPVSSNVAKATLPIRFWNDTSSTTTSINFQADIVRDLYTTNGYGGVIAGTTTIGSTHSPQTAAVLAWFYSLLDPSEY